MIVEFIFNILFGIVSSAFDILPDFSWNFDPTVIQPIVDVINIILYFFPTGIVSVIFAFYIWMKTFQNIIATLRTVWEILPIV